MKTSADVVVIGGGVVGTAITYQLAKRGMDVCNVERSGIASGTSSRCDGRITISDQVPGDSLRLAKASMDMFPGLSDELGHDIEWSQEGILLLTESEAEFEVAKQHCVRMVEAGLPYRILDQRELRARHPCVADDIVGAVDITCDGLVNPMALAQGFTHAAQRHGAATAIHAPVLEIKRDAAGAVSHVVTDAGTIATGKVVNAAGVWAPDLGAMVGLDIPIQPRQGQLLVMERGNRVMPPGGGAQEFSYIMVRLQDTAYKRQTTPAMDKYGIAFAYEPTEGGTGLVGTSRYFAGRDTASNPDILRELAKRAIRFYPALRDVHVIRTYAGLRPYTPDHLPIISDTEVPGFYVAAGHEGNGITMSALTGELMANLISGEKPRIDVAPFAWSRFAAGSRAAHAGGQH